MLPAAGIFDRPLAPHTGSAIEIEKHMGAGAGAVFEDEMTVEQNGFNVSEERIVAIQVCPASLDHADFRIAKIMNDTQQEIFRGHKVGVEDSNEFAFCRLHSFL